jgi:hypothetical protein
MKRLREIWKYKKKYQNGDKEAAFDLYINYNCHFHAYSDAKIWAQRQYDASHGEHYKKFITKCDKKIQLTVKG